MNGASGIAPHCAHRRGGAEKHFGKAFTRTMRAFCVALSLISAAAPGNAAEPVTVGVLAQGPPSVVAARWAPTAQYLHARIPTRDFAILPLTTTGAAEAVNGQSVDFILLNPVTYVRIQASAGIERIATVKNRWSGKARAAFGGVVVRHAQRSDIKTFADLADLRVAAVDETSLGGWIAAKAEFLRDGIDADSYFRTFAFLGSNEAVVHAILEGRADAGILRSGVLEQMAEAGTIAPTDLVTIKGTCCHGDTRPDEGEGPHGIPVRVSTRLYPDWPLAKLPHAPDVLAEHVAVALIQMSPDDPAAIAAEIGGWSIPADYEPVRAVLKQLGIAPFDDDIADRTVSVAKRYWPYLAFAFAIILMLILGAIYVVRLNRVYRRSEAHIRALVEASPAGIFFKDADRRYVLANRAYCDFHRIEGNSILGKRAEEFQPPDHAKRTDEEDLQVYRTQAQVQVEESLPGEGGQLRYFSLRKFPVRNAKGLFIGWGGISIEMTEQKRTEMALKEREARYRSVITTTHDGFWMADPTGRLIEVNDAYVRQSGFSREELLTMHIGDLDEKETPEDRIRRTNRLIRSGSDLFITKHRQKNGGTWDAEVRISHSPIEGGRFFAFHRDIGERQRAEERLRESEERFRRLYHELPMPYQSLDEGGCIIEVNQAWTALFGYERNEAIGTAFSDLVAKEDRPDLWRNFARLRATGRVHIPAYTMIGKDGKQHVVAVDATTAESATQRFVQTHCVLTDITDREFLERQLAHAQKMDAVGQLTGGIAHDFNNLLQVVETNLELAQMEVADAPDAKRFIERASKAGRRGADLTQQLLAFSRKQTLNPRTVEPNALIDGMLSLLARTLGEDITIETHLEDALPTIHVDANGLENAILNLALNARTAMRDGGTLRVTSRRCSPINEALKTTRPCCLATISRSPSPIPAAACPKPSWSAPSNLSSPPRMSARAAASGSAWCTGSCVNRVASCVWKAHRAPAPRPASCCPPGSRPARRTPRLARKTAPRPSSRRQWQSWSSRTTNRSASRRRCFCARWAVRCARRVTRTPVSKSSTATRRSTCC